MSRAMRICAVVVLVVLVPSQAHSVPFTVALEPGGGFFLAKPQQDRYGPGFDLGLRVGLPLVRDLIAPQVSYGFFVSAPANGHDAAGGIHSLTGGILVRPLQLLTRRPWLGGLHADANLGWAATGSESRFTFDAGLGFDYGVTRRLRLGLFTRYVHVVQPNSDPVLDHGDPRYLVIGLGATYRYSPEPPAPRPAPVVRVIQLPPITVRVPQVITKIVKAPPPPLPPPPERLAIPAILMFAINGYQISEQFQRALNVYAEYFNKYDLTNDLICIRGHASADPCPCNDVLAQVRADAVLKLIRRRVPRNAASFAAAGAGDTKQLTRDSRDAALNRRVIFEYLHRDSGECVPIDLGKSCSKKWDRSKAGQYCAALCRAALAEHAAPSARGGER
jgi:outer membrane protein OmpA-like peptidoglycan-associated protein